MTAQHIVSLSGGKDSLATALKAKERGKPFRVVFADTGNEDQITLDYVDNLEGYLGVPVETVRADFTAAFALRREQLHKFWSRPGRVGSDGHPTPAVPDALIERAIACLIPSGIPFLDLCMLNHRRGDYVGETFVGRDAAALDRQQVSKRGSVANYPRLDLHVWNLVARMLASMGYTK